MDQGKGGFIRGFCVRATIEYSYKSEDMTGIPTLPSGRNRTVETCSRNRFLMSVKYGNQVSNQRDGWDRGINPWMLKLGFDYWEQDFKTLPTAAGDASWACRADPFSSCRAEFAIHTSKVFRSLKGSPLRTELSIWTAEAPSGSCG